MWPPSNPRQSAPSRPSASSCRPTAESRQARIEAITPRSGRSADVVEVDAEAACAAVLGFLFSAYAFRLWRHYSDELARKTFRFSILYLSLLFAALLVDHYDHFFRS